MTTATKINPVESFLSKVREDGHLRSQLEQLENRPKKQAIQEIVHIANKMNFKFSAKQYEQYAMMICTRNAQADRAIEDRDLIRVACGQCD